MPNVFTIPADLCFVSTLAAGLWRRVEGDPLALASYTVFLPTRRACRALREAFLRATEARAALLPRMQPLGDVDEVELDLADASALADLPPAISPLRRQMLLMQLVLKKDAALPMDQAASLAQALGDLLDQAQTEGRDLAALAGLVPDDYAAHWQETLRFLNIVTEAWPAILQAEGCLDPAARRRAVLLAQAKRWREMPPEHPVIAAGSTGSVPAVGELMNVIACLPRGEVILPGLDLALDNEAWDAIDDVHPQATMKSWLEVAKIRRNAVRVWEDVVAPHPARTRLFSEAMRPAAVTERWRDLTAQDLPPDAAAGLSRLDLDHHREEADVIALRLRAALEDEGKTAALVTPDRALAARVAASLGRWGIAANDSAGSPLTLWPVGSYLTALLEAAAPEASPVAFLSFLKHPLTACGIAPALCRSRARTVEMKRWRGVRPAGGLSGAAQALAQEEPALAAWLAQIAAAFAPVTEGWGQEKPLADWLALHLALAENLAASEAEPGAARLWRGEAGEAAALWLAEMREASAGFPALTGAAYARLFAALAQQVVVRPAYGLHPRLSLLGPLEARLLHHDLVILGGLNEGVWPPAPPIDPWLSRPMKQAFGLPSPERRVGLSAHDFVQLACADEVVLTRARRVGGSPSVPSRFLAQLDAVLEAVGLRAALAPALPWRAWARALDEPERVVPMDPPRPCPPLAARPSRLSVTEIGTWLRNPYAIYAKHVLGLRKLEEIDAEVSPADHGNAIHEALEKFLKQTQTAWPADPLALLLEEGRRALAPYADRPQVQAFWAPRFERLARWFIETQERRRAEGIKPLALEASGRMAWRDGAFVLTGRADRIDLLPDGQVEVIDYKTGSLPKKALVLAGVEPQLALLGLMTAAGAFGVVGAKQAGALSYWGLKGSASGETVVTFDQDLAAQQEQARVGLEALLEAFADPATPYEAVPKPRLAPRYDDYAHLARQAEWGRAVESDEEGAG